MPLAYTCCRPPLSRADAVPASAVVICGRVRNKERRGVCCSLAAEVVLLLATAAGVVMVAVVGARSGSSWIAWG